ncbi:MAG TPA: hypothetical protein VFN26_22400 [Candidatus Acidoferrum sp.]|nr:hypothetical protein [Candidatus Acidoferrum sp.]
MFPRARQICFELLLPRLVPRIVVALGNAHALVSQQHAHALYWHTGEKQFDSEGVAQSVWMTV